MTNPILVIMTILALFFACTTKKDIDEQYDKDVTNCYLILILSAAQSQTSSSSNRTSSSPGSSIGSTCIKDASKKRARERSRTLL